MHPTVPYPVPSFPRLCLGTGPERYGTAEGVVSSSPTHVVRQLATTWVGRFLFAHPVARLLAATWVGVSGNESLWKR
ncbi:MAG: hypothetical protein EBE86_031790 [Hormoscilla sp. GUM202]|nr:hypothetical protein [Hormoscilla sp. GUM202]